MKSARTQRPDEDLRRLVERMVAGDRAAREELARALLDIVRAMLARGTFRRWHHDAAQISDREQIQLFAHIDTCDECARLASQVALGDGEVTMGHPESTDSTESTDLGPERPILPGDLPLFTSTRTNRGTPMIPFPSNRKLLTRAIEVVALLAVAVVVYVVAVGRPSGTGQEPIEHHALSSEPIMVEPGDCATSASRVKLPSSPTRPPRRSSSRMA